MAEAVVGGSAGDEAARAGGHQITGGLRCQASASLPWGPQKGLQWGLMQMPHNGRVERSEEAGAVGPEERWGPQTRTVGVGSECEVAVGGFEHLSSGLSPGILSWWGDSGWALPLRVSLRVLEAPRGTGTWKMMLVTGVWREA